MTATAGTPLDQDRLRQELIGSGGLWTSVDVATATGSTNADLAALARSGAEPGSALLTGFQSAGRGRLDRTWTAPPGTSIACSVLVRPEVAAARWTWLPLLSGLAVAESLRRATGVAAALKWPNDVLVGERKLCGILAERVETPTVPMCVVGMGINVSLSPEQLPVPSATSLAMEGATTLDANVIAITVLRAFALLFREWESAGNDAAFAAAYVARCTTIGRTVKVDLGSEVVTGAAEAVDAAGRLVVRTASGLRPFGAGDVTHLR